MFVEETEAEAQGGGGRPLRQAPAALTRDPDVLDTWFSSALWPFSTLGWPEQTKELERYYPGDVLVTGFDIIFFWVARMMMMGLHFMGDVPFRTSTSTPWSATSAGQKMSKSKGNVIDPLELIDEYGCDALRFTLAAMAAQGRDIKLAEQPRRGLRNFATKLWNAARYCQMNECVPVAGFDPDVAQADRSTAGSSARLAKTVGARVEQAMAQYRFNDAASALYQFTWDTFCDWYLEFTKPILNGSDDGGPRPRRAPPPAGCSDEILHLLHPFMPFITEELWEQMRGDQREHADPARWPDYSRQPIASDHRRRDGLGVRLIDRGARVAGRDEHSARADADAADPGRRRGDARAAGAVRRSGEAPGARRQDRDHRAEPPKGAAQIVLDEATIFVPLTGVIDIAQERARLSKELGKAKGEAERIEKKLGNEQFLAKANPEVVVEQRQKLEEFNLAVSKLTQALDRLTGL